MVFRYSSMLVDFIILFCTNPNSFQLFGFTIWFCTCNYHYLSWLSADSWYLSFLLVVCSILYIVHLKQMWKLAWGIFLTKNAWYLTFVSLFLPLPHWNLLAITSDCFRLMQVLNLFHGSSEEGIESIIYSDNGFEQVLSVIFVQCQQDALFLFLIVSWKCICLRIHNHFSFGITKKLFQAWLLVGIN